MNYPYTVNIKSEKETVDLAAEFAGMLKPGDIIALNGELGSGKTFFIKSLCKNWGIENVTSPSFTIMNDYKGKFEVFHFDFYRIKKTGELYDIGFDEYVNDQNMISFIEWAYLFKEIIPLKHYLIDIKSTGDTERRIVIDKFE